LPAHFLSRLNEDRLMKRLAFVFALLLAPAALAQDKPAQEKPAEEKPAQEAASPFKSNKEKASYAAGLQIAANLKEAFGEVDLAALTKGLTDALSGGKRLLSEEESEVAIRAYLTEAAEKQAAESKKQGDAFLAANKVKEGVKTLESGLQYKVLKSGMGAMPKASDSVTTHYRGTLIDGTVFDSSYDRGEPATFPVGGVIRGWTEALQLMKVGDKWQLFIPSELAYGERGSRGAIPPNAVLVFEIELISIAKPE
jgi:FKBP-type peptidyl-prolyl cis-trans isomerase FklB